MVFEPCGRVLGPELCRTKASCRRKVRKKQKKKKQKHDRKEEARSKKQEAKERRSGSKLHEQEASKEETEEDQEEGEEEDEAITRSKSHVRPLVSWCFGAARPSFGGLQAGIWSYSF